MIFASIIILFWCLLLWVAIKWNAVKKFWAQRNVPHVTPHPVLGSLRFLQRENPAVFMKEMYKKFDSPYVGIWLFWRPGIIVNSPDLARNILIKDFDNFKNRFLSCGKTDTVGGHNLFTIKDPLWSFIRKRVTTIFTGAKLRAAQNVMRTKASDLVNRIEEESKRGPVHNIREILVDYTTDVIGEAVLGVTSEATRTGGGIIRKVSGELMEFNVQRGLSWSSIFFFPELTDYFRLSFFPKKTMKLLGKILATIMEERKANDDVKRSKDLLDILLLTKKEAIENGENLPEDIVVAQAAGFLLGGFETTGATLAWLILEVAFNPKIQEKLYNEIEDVKAKSKFSEFDSTTLAKMPYLNAIIKEALRKYPTMGWLDRVAEKAYKVDDKLTIPAGTVVYVNTVGMHWDPKHFKNPETFDPERFMPENECYILPYTFMPFGEGQRNCIGLRYSVQAMTFALASIFSRFTVSPIPNSKKPNDFIYEKRGLFLTPGEPISVNFHLRRNGYQN